MVYLDLSIVSIVTESCGEIKYNQTGTEARGKGSEHQNRRLWYTDCSVSAIENIPR